MRFRYVLVPAASYNPLTMSRTITPHRTDEQLLAALQELAASLVAAHHPALPPVSVRLSARLTRCAGTYRPPGQITISRHFARQHGLEAAEAVLRHEVAHHAVRHTVVGRIRPHGPEFLATAAALGAPRYAPSFSAPRTVHGYRCPACGWTWLRGRRIARRRRYACGRCAPSYDERFRLAYVGSWRSEDQG